MVGYFDATATTFPIPEGVVLATGNAIAAIGPNNSSSYTDKYWASAGPNDPDMAMIGSPYVQNNEAILEFDFIPTGDSVVFNYVFASEEYPDYCQMDLLTMVLVSSQRSWICWSFAEWRCKNIAIIPGCWRLPVTMNNLKTVHKPYLLC
ncbi:MAG: choice-of-anchor L domain-containing protein [Crocinitomicaceae bacterium]|nr:choice-of-anchor L domain-containing protein [Crocinitomicaceae bacterium]